MNPSEIAPAKAVIQRMLAAAADSRPSAAELLKEFSHPDPPQPSVSGIESLGDPVSCCPLLVDLAHLNAFSRLCQDFAVLRQLGSGAFGEVFLCK